MPTGSASIAITVAATSSGCSRESRGAGAGALRAAPGRGERLAARRSSAESAAGDAPRHGRYRARLTWGHGLWVLVALLCWGDSRGWRARCSVLSAPRSGPQPVRTSAAPAARGEGACSCPLCSARPAAACLWRRGPRVAGPFRERVGCRRQRGADGPLSIPTGHPAPTSPHRQRGRRYSLTSFRGHVVVLDSPTRAARTSVDHLPRVRGSGRVLGRTNADVDFVSVNVNRSTIASATLPLLARARLDELLNWYFMTGSPASCVRCGGVTTSP